MAAFSLAQEMGAREVELDVRFSRDRRLVLCHDDGLDRLGYPGCFVSKMTLGELKSLDFGRWVRSQRFAGERVITLDELLAHFARRLIYHVEIKDRAEGIEAAVLEVLSEHAVERQSVITSFDDERLQTVKRLSPQIAVGWLVRSGGLSKENVKRAASLGFDQICPRANEIELDQVSEAHRSIHEVRAFGVRTPDDALRVIESGCDGLTIDHLEWFIQDP